MVACSGSVSTPPTAGAAGEVVEHPSLETFLRTILVDKLEKTEEYLAQTVKAFKDRDVISTELLLQLFSDTKDADALKKELTVNGAALSIMVWNLVMQQLESLRPEPQPKRVKLQRTVHDALGSASKVAGGGVWTPHGVKWSAGGGYFGVTCRPPPPPDNPRNSLCLYLLSLAV